MKRLLHLLGQAGAAGCHAGGLFSRSGSGTQQYFGPLYDLEMASVNLNWESDVVNHQPTPENQNLCIYGDLTGFSYKRSFDANGIRIIDDSGAAGRMPKSGVGLVPWRFVHGGLRRQEHAALSRRKYFKTERGVCLKTYNAGFTSYSPAIFVPQAKKLLPIVRPDYIVVDVDETDLYDDFARYRHLIVRNERGQNIGVKVHPSAMNAAPA